MSRLCLDDRVLLIELYLTSNKSVTEAIRKFCTTKRIKKVAEKPSRSTVYALIRKFQMTGNVADLDRSGTPTLQDIRSPVVEELVDESHGRISTSKISRISNISQSSVHRILTNQLKLHPYRIQVVHSLSDRDKENRVTFANEMLNRISEDPTLVQNILWTDEAHFCLSGEVNTWNSRIWATENPNVILQQPLHSPKVTVWAGFNSSFLLEPYFFEEGSATVSVNADRYCELLNQHVVPQLKAKRALSRTIFQQDGAAPHTARLTKKLLQRYFGELKVISRRYSHAVGQHVVLT